MNRAVPAALLVLLSLLTWELASRIAGSWILPPPSAVFTAVGGQLIVGYALTAYRSIVGFVLGSLIGVSLGLVAASMRSFPEVLSLASSVLAAIPPVVLVPLLILWLGFGGVLPMAASTIAALVPISYNLLSAAANVDPGISDYLSTLRMGPASRLDVLSHILMPYIFPGLRFNVTLDEGQISRYSELLVKYGVVERNVSAGEVISRVQP